MHITFYIIQVEVVVNCVNVLIQPRLATSWTTRGQLHECTEFAITVIEVLLVIQFYYKQLQ